MSEIKDGGPAFPHGKYMKHATTGAFDTYAHGGMSLRDHFASSALAGMLASEAADGGFYKSADVAERAYKIADAMIAQRDKDGQP